MSVGWAMLGTSQGKSKFSIGVQPKPNQFQNLDQTGQDQPKYLTLTALVQVSLDGYSILIHTHHSRRMVRRSKTLLI